MAHTDSARCLSVYFGKVMGRPFPVKGVSLPTLSFIIPPLFGFTDVLGVYVVGLYCCIVVCWNPRFLWDSVTVSLGGGGGGGNLILNWYDIL